MGVNKFLGFSLLVFWATALVSDYYLYTNWDTSNHQVDTSWWLLYVNSLMLSIIAIMMTIYLLGETYCWKPLRTLIDCLASLVCVGPLLKSLYYISLVGYFVVCGYLVRHISFDSDRYSELRFDHPYLFKTYWTQLGGAALLIVFTVMYIVTSPCRWTNCCTGKKEGDEGDSYTSMEDDRV